MSNPDGFCFNHFISRVHLDGVFQATSGCHDGQSSQTHGLHLHQTARFPPTKMRMMGVVRRINKEEIGLASNPLLAKVLSRILLFGGGVASSSCRKNGWWLTCRNISFLECCCGRLWSPVCHTLSPPWPSAWWTTDFLMAKNWGYQFECYSHPLISGFINSVPCPPIQKDVVIVAGLQVMSWNMNSNSPLLLVMELILPHHATLQS